MKCYRDIAGKGRHSGEIKLKNHKNTCCPDKGIQTKREDDNVQVVFPFSNPPGGPKKEIEKKISPFFLTSSNLLSGPRIQPSIAPSVLQALGKHHTNVWMILPPRLKMKQANYELSCRQATAFLSENQVSWREGD